MTKIESLRMELKCREMVDGTELDWWEVIRHNPTKQNLANTLNAYYPENVELALGIIEGKPVWKGDMLYFVNKDESYYQQIATPSHDFTLVGWSRNLPKLTTTVMEKELTEIKYKYNQAHQELIQIHHIGMCIAECPPIKSEDSSTVRMVKEMTYRLNRVETK